MASPFAGARGPTAKAPDRLTLNGPPAFSGKLKTPSDPRCRVHRRVNLVEATVPQAITHVRTDQNGAFSAPSNFVGRAYASVKRLKEVEKARRPNSRARRPKNCPALRSFTVTFPGVTDIGVLPPTADLAIAKVAAGNDGSAVQYNVTVTNLGLDAAAGVVVTDTPDADFVATGSDPRCGPDGAAVFTCTIGTLAAGDQTTLFVKTACPGATTTNSASVSASTVDPNQNNNSVSNVSETCPA
jgi:uncharacterized repeat protein (TIGR01451 family)